MNPNKVGKRAVFLYTLDSDTEFFHLLTEAEWLMAVKPMPYQVFWQSKKSRTVYGPFMTVHSAMEHYTLTKHPAKAEITTRPTPIAPVPNDVETALNVLTIDFKARKRVY